MPLVGKSGAAGASWMTWTNFDVARLALRRRRHGYAGAVSVARRIHVYKTGRLLRYWVLPSAIIEIGCAVIGTTVSPTPASVDWPMFGLIVAVIVLIAARSLLFGVWLIDGKLVARSWLRTNRLDVREIGRCDRVPYWGLIYGWRESRSHSMLSLRLENGSTLLIRSTIASRRVSQRQVEEIRAYLDAASDS
jgi:hypothetical protein